MKIIISGNPEPKARHRSFIRGKSIVSYDPQESIKKIFSYRLNKFFKELRDDKKYNSFSVETHYYIKIPNSYSEKERNKCLWGINKPRHCDTDNLVKFTWDAANAILWPDDRMIDEMRATKQYSEKPRTEIIMTQCNVDEHDEVAELLGLCSPNEWKKIVSDAHRLALYAFLDDETVISADLRKEMAFILARFAQNHSKMLSKINKKFPDCETFQLKQKVPGEGKTLC